MATREQMRRAEQLTMHIDAGRVVRLFHGMLRAEGVAVWCALDETQMNQVLNSLDATPAQDRAAWIDGFCQGDEEE